MNREWMIKSIDSEPQGVSGRVIRPDLVLVEGGLRQHISYIDQDGIVRRHETTVPFSRQIHLTGALPGHFVQVETEVRHIKPKSSSKFQDATLLSLSVTAEDDSGIVGIRTDEHMLKDLWKLIPDVKPAETGGEESLEPEPVLQESSISEEELRSRLEQEYYEKYEQTRAQLEEELHQAYLQDLQDHLTAMRREMEAELSRRWKQQLSSFQKRTGFRGSVEFGSA